MPREGAIPDLPGYDSTLSFLREGYGFKQDSPFFPICADVVLKPKPVEGHTHQIIYPKPVLDREWLDSGDAEQPAAAVRIPVSPYGQASD